MLHSQQSELHSAKRQAPARKLSPSATVTPQASYYGGHVFRSHLSHLYLLLQAIHCRLLLGEMAKKVLNNLCLRIQLPQSIHVDHWDGVVVCEFEYVVNFLKHGGEPCIQQHLLAFDTLPKLPLTSWMFLPSTFRKFHGQSPR